MEIKTTYKGYLNNVFGIYCGFCPQGLDITEQVPVYYPSEGKVFVKDGEEYSAVVLQDGETIEDYQEIDIPEEQDNGIEVS